jgi:hypothetical protein
VALIKSNSWDKTCKRLKLKLDSRTFWSKIDKKGLKKFNSSGFS